MGSTPISEVSFKITKSGSYCLTKDLTITSVSDTILVQADNVILDLGGHTLTLPLDNIVSGIFIGGRSNVTIKNGIIIGSNQASAILVDSSQNIFIENVIFDALNAGLVLISTNNITVTDCVFRNMNVSIEFTAVCILNFSSSNGVIENSFFINNNGFSSDPTGCIVFTYDDPTNVVSPSNWTVLNS